jgi:hypothetical protein
MFNLSGARVDSLDKYLESHRDEAAGIAALADRARDYLKSFSWCARVSGLYVGGAMPPMFGIFLADIVPAKAGVDRWLWVVVGDLPPAYLVTDDAPDAAAALEAYDAEMSAWVDAVRRGSPTDDLIPVNVPGTSEYANMLEARLELLRNEVLPHLARNEGES